MALAYVADTPLSSSDQIAGFGCLRIFANKRMGKTGYQPNIRRHIATSNTRISLPHFASLMTGLQRTDPHRGATTVDKHLIYNGKTDPLLLYPNGIGGQEAFVILAALSSHGHLAAIDIVPIWSRGYSRRMERRVGNGPSLPLRDVGLGWQGHHARIVRSADCVSAHWSMMT
ncbi:hypothetical protein ACR720_05895 [Sphingomonas parapaucimobilis]|uniref:hypothetical protein n=1 Tax=Sphingomonas parapaucimobilis TaxID=28213 RepID=UPI0039E772CE